MKRTHSAMRVLGAVLLLGLTAAGRTEEGAEAPNILFIFADDQAYTTIRSLGHPVIETPNLDRLVGSGTTFTHAYNQGSWSGAVCVASRCMLVTGRFLWNANRVYRTAEKEREAGRFWSEHLKRAGYQTFMTGKWHIRASAEKAFDHAGHVRGGMPNQTKEGYNRPVEGKPDPWSPYDPKFGGFWKGGKHWSEVVADDALDFFKRSSTSEKPFFMYVAFNAPHDPRQAPKEYVDKYPLDRVDLPPNFLPEYPWKDAIGCSARLRDEKLAPFPRTEYAVKVNRQEYYAIITHMDAQIGRILDALDRSGKKKDTVIFFTADHGLGVGNHGLLGKQNLYDHSVRVPFIVSGRGIPGGRKIATPIYLQDVMPTTLELAGLEKPDHVEFKSLLPLLGGDGKAPYDAVYGAYLAVQRSVTQDGHKLILYPKIKKTLLYNLKDDPHEMKDLSEEADQKERMGRLFKRLLGLQKEVGDPLDLKSVFPDL